MQHYFSVEYGMKRYSAILFFFLFAAAAMGQTQFRTIVPQTPIVVGDAFQVQYVIDDGETATGFISPVFKGFKTVAGPYVYSGKSRLANNDRQSKNYVFTLVASNPGKQIISGTFITVDGKQVRSNDNYIEVISKEMAMKRFEKEVTTSSDYYLRPGEDVQQKIMQNLFMKVQVDKKTCFVGEPVVATFKLYSRLESKSDIVKNPGFYGFSVLDVINLSDRFVTTEQINGKAFDVHTIRKVQLYPLQAGIFTIDAMEVKNRVEFSRSKVKRKTEQEIVEGVLNNEREEVGAKAEVFENDINTEPVNIVVKPIPQKEKPISFSGAVGNFSISAAIVDQELSANEEGRLEIVIEGTGNFIQLNAPIINWPAGVEGFDPEIKDSLDVYVTPLKGKRKFRYAFVASAPGSYIFPPISFTFFNIDTGVYKTVTTKPQQLTISEKKLQSISFKERKQSNSNKMYWLAVAGVVVILSVIIFWIVRKRKSNKVESTISIVEKRTFSSIDAFLQSSQLLATDKDFYTTLHQSIWNFFGTYYKLSGTEMNKENLFTQMRESGIHQSLIEETATILQQCETGMFTNVSITEDRELFFNSTKRLLGEIEQALL